MAEKQRVSYHLTIPGRLIGQNEVTGANRSSKYIGSAQKKKWQQYVALFIRQQLTGVQLSSPVWLDYHWYEPSRRRDLDNIASGGMKIIQDALVREKVLKSDGWRGVRGFSHRFSCCPEDPRIEITITEIES